MLGCWAAGLLGCSAFALLCFACWGCCLDSGRRASPAVGSPRLQGRTCSAPTPPRLQLPIQSTNSPLATKATTYHYPLHSSARLSRLELPSFRLFSRNSTLSLPFATSTSTSTSLDHCCNCPMLHVAFDRRLSSQADASHSSRPLTSRAPTPRPGQSLCHCPRN